MQSKSWTKILRFIAVIPEYVGYELKFTFWKEKLIEIFLILC